ncbi:MAG: hypothetical protein ABEH81_02690 [Halopenitus sp.]
MSAVGAALASVVAGAFDGVAQAGGPGVTFNSSLVDVGIYLAVFTILSIVAAAGAAIAYGGTSATSSPRASRSSSAARWSRCTSTLPRSAP